MNPTETYDLRASSSYVDDPYFFMHPEKTVIEKPNPGWRIINEGKARGRLIGGHLGTLLTLAGTKYWPGMKDKLLFIEDHEDDNPKNLRREFRHLDHLGVLDDINGLLIGRVPEMTGVKDELWVGALVDDILENREYPIVAEMDFGHTNPIATIPVGVQAEISTQKNTLTYLEPSVR